MEDHLDQGLLAEENLDFLAEGNLDLLAEENLDFLKNLDFLAEGNLTFNSDSRHIFRYLIICKFVV